MTTENITFAAMFIVSHTLAYTLAGAVILQVSKDIYENKNRLCNFLRDMADEKESKHVSKYFLPAQIVRGLLMALAFMPFSGVLAEFGFLKTASLSAAFVFVFTHLASASPFIDNIEGFVYFKSKYFKTKAFLKFQTEMIFYSILFGLFIALSIKHVV